MPRKRKRPSKQRNAGGLGAGATVETRKEFAAQTQAEIELYGSRSIVPAEIFTVYGNEAYRIDKEQLIPLRSCEEASHADAAREREARQRLVVNAGRKTPSNPEAGVCFHADFGFTPKDSDVQEIEWHDPKPLTHTLGTAKYCSDADALARYAGGKALAHSAELFMILFLNGGESALAASPSKDSLPSSEFLRQKQRILLNLRKMFLVCPFFVDPQVGPDGWPYPISRTSKTDSIHEQVVTPMMLGCFASIVADKREGAPARNASICGYHDKCRLHIMPKGHVRKIRQLVQYFDLSSQLPPVWDNLENGQVALEPYRQAALLQIKRQHPNRGPDNNEWNYAHSTMLFAKPWVQRCNMAHPQGEEHADVPGMLPIAVLVPLVYGGAEERNGVPWLYLEEEDDSPHARSVRDALVRIAGRLPEKRRDIAELEDIVRALRLELAEAAEKFYELLQRHSRLEARMDKSTVPSKSKH